MLGLEDFPLLEDFPTASEERFPLLRKRDATAKEVCTANEDKVDLYLEVVDPYLGNNKWSLETGEEAGIERSMDKGSNDIEEMVNVLTSLDAASILTSGVQVSVPPAAEVATVSIPPAGEILTVSVPTGSGVVPTACPIFTTATVATPYARRKGKEKMVESETPKKKKLQEQIDVKMARQLEEKMARDAQRMNEQIARDAKIARIHAEEELQMMIDGLDRSNEMIAKHLHEYKQAADELTIREKIELINELVTYQDHHSKILKYKAQQKQDSAKKVKTLEEVSEEGLKELMQLVPVEEVYVEALQVKHPIIDWEIHSEGQRIYWKIIRMGGSKTSYQLFVDMMNHFDREDLNQLWALVKKTLNIKQATNDKEKELWVELKRLYEPDVENQLDEFPLPEDFPTASEERFPLPRKRDTTAEEVCTANKDKVDPYLENNKWSLETGEEAGIKKSMDKGSNDIEEMVNVPTSLDAASILTSEVQVSVPPAAEVAIVSIPPTGEIPTVSVPTSSGVVPTTSPIFTTATVATLYSKRKGKEKMVESEMPKKKKLQEQIDVQMARQLKEEIARDAQRMNEQIARDAEIGRIHIEEELQMMIDGLNRSNEMIAKHLHEYKQSADELTIGEIKELINKLVKYQDHHLKILKYKAQQSKPLSKKQQREIYMSVLKSHSGWKTKHFKGMSLEEIREKFILVWKQIKDFLPMGSKEEGERFKRKGLRLEQDSAKKVKTSEEVSEEDLKEMMQLVLVEEVYVEALQVKHIIIDWEIHSEGQRSYWKIIRLGGSTRSYQFFVDMLNHFDREDLNKLWVLVKETLNIRQATSDKEKKLWVELKRLYEPDVEDQLWTQT
uniref:Uncharacterized protein n=1 Tax=Tanacetum cinerariifolium TaxID=118510 RepID=A0A6L2IZN5_TANCI|nr:hypothetical protein [Tanacetum cinerariifolium]